VGTRLDRLYLETDQKWLDYKEIDELVKEYKESNDSAVIDQRRKDLLRAFHKYFMKYVALLKGMTKNIDKSDTVSFLALFLSGAKIFSDYEGIRKYIVRVCRSIEDIDVYNELVIIFLQLLERFKFYPSVSFSRFC